MKINDIITYTHSLASPEELQVDYINCVLKQKMIGKECRSCSRFCYCQLMLRKYKKNKTNEIYNISDKRQLQRQLRKEAQVKNEHLIWLVFDSTGMAIDVIKYIIINGYICFRNCPDHECTCEFFEAGTVFPVITADFMEPGDTSPCLLASNHFIEPYTFLYFPKN